MDPTEGDSIVTVVAIRPLGPADDMEIFGTILRRAAEGARLSGGSGKLSRAAGGQAFKVEGEGIEFFMSPITDEPFLVLLMVTGRPTEPNEEVVEAILGGQLRMRR